MADEPHVIRGINWRETFPWTHIFRGFRVAIHPSKLVLALIAITIVYAGGRILDAMWGRTPEACPTRCLFTNRWGIRFPKARAAARTDVEQRYAQMLLDQKVLNNADDAKKAAEKEEKYGELKDKIVATRTDAAKAAEDVHTKAIEAAKNSDSAARKKAEKDADDARRQTVSAAYDRADGQLARPGKSRANRCSICIWVMRFRASMTSSKACWIGTGLAECARGARRWRVWTRVRSPTAGRWPLWRGRGRRRLWSNRREC